MKKKTIILFLCAAMLFGSCGAAKPDSEIGAMSTPQPSTAVDPTAPGFGSTPGDGANPGTPSSGFAISENGENNTKSSALTVSASDMFTDRDSRTEYDQDTAIDISLTGSFASCTSPDVSVNGGTVTICGEGTYVLSGNLDDGMVIIDTDKNTKVCLVLAGVSIHSCANAAIYVKKADKVFITLAEDTENTLSNGGTYTAMDDNNIDAVIFSKDDLTINGNGTLTVTAPAGHGIVSKNDLVVTGGDLRITAAEHGMAGKDSIRIAGGNFLISAGKDGLHANNDEDESAGFIYLAGGAFEISAGGDGIDASSDLTVAGGSFQISAGGGKANTKAHAQDAFGGWGRNFPGNTAGNLAEASVSTKGLKASGDLTVLAGTLTIDSADDGLHCGGNLCIADGTLTIATGDDGLHADNALSILSGTINITDSYEGIEGKTIGISGGNISLCASDDGLNAAGGNDASGFWQGRGNDQFASQDGVSIRITGGSLHINANGDGIDSNGDLTVTGGSIYVDGPSGSGNGAIDKNGTALIHGGTLVAVGAAGMAETFDPSSTQGCILINTASTQTAGTKTELFDASGNLLVSYTAAKSFSSVVISDPSIIVGGMYTLKVGTETFEITMTTTSYGFGMGMGGFGQHGGKWNMDGTQRPGEDGNPGTKPGRDGADGDTTGRPGMNGPNFKN